jgi:uncharacterized membrane protein
MSETEKTITDIITEDELKEFYRLLPKFQEAQYFLGSLDSEENTEEQSELSGNRPYTIEIDVTATVFMKNNSAVIAPDIVEKNSKKFYIDLMTSDWASLINTFFENVTNSMTETCKNIYKQDETK